MKKWLIATIVLLLITPAIQAEKMKAQQAKDIIKQYELVLKNKDYNQWKKLILNIGDWDEKEFSSELNSPVQQLIIDEIDRRDTSCDVRVIVETMNASTAHSRKAVWVQILPDGKIKYDLFIEHPLPRAMMFCNNAALAARNKQSDSSQGKGLVETGIPLFGYDPEASYSDQLDALKVIKDWLLDDGKEWDISEPMIPCPEDIYDFWKRNLNATM